MEISMVDVSNGGGFVITERIQNAYVEAPVCLESSEGDNLLDLTELNYSYDNSRREIYIESGDSSFALYKDREILLEDTSLEEVKEYLKSYFEIKGENFEL